MAVTGTNTTLTTRTAKGSALTHAELDANQTGLKAAIENHSHNEFAAALGPDDNYMTDAEKTKLAGIATGAEVNVQADWNASTGDAAIMNKPEIPSINGLLNESAHDALDHSGLPGVPASYTLPVASATVLGGVKVDGTTVLISDGVISSTGGGGGGVTDHGLLTGLSDDDHPQYHNDTRGDARYSQTTHNHSLNNLTEKSYNSLTDKPSIPSVSGLLNETAHAALDHAGLPGVLAIGTTGTTACAGNDSRLSDSRTPTGHSHAQSDVIGLVTALSGKQATLVSGTNIKTINGTSVLGSGDIEVTGGSGGASVQQATVTLSQNASTNITATSVLSVYEQVVGASLIPAMTSNTTPYGTVSADSSYSGSYAYLAVDGSISSGWNSLFTASPHWLKYDGAVGTAIQYSIDCLNHAAQAPKDFELRHSADGGTTWTTLDSRTNITNWTSKNTYTISTPATTPNGIYQLYVTAGITSEVVIHEFSLLGAPTYNKLLSTDYAVTRFAATKNQIQTITRLKTGTAVMVIDYI